MDEHTLQAIGIINDTARGKLKDDHPLATEIVQLISDMEALMLGMLLHDVGKGGERGQLEDGAIAARRACERLGVDPRRIELVDFAEPYVKTGLVMVVRPGLEAIVKTVQDLAGLRVGVKIGATGAKLAQDLLAQGIALQIVEYKETLDSFLDLEVGRVDVVFNDYLNTLVYLKNSQSGIIIVEDNTGKTKFLSHVGLGIAVHQGDQELLQAINATLLEMKQDGTFNRLYQTWLSGAARD